MGLLGRLRSIAAELERYDGNGGRAADLISIVSALEDLKCRAEGAQVMAIAAFDTTQRAAQAAAGVPADRQSQGVALQVALARRESHHLGQRHLGLARTLVTELPCTLAALRGGRTSAWRATLVARETACLTRQDRTTVDQQLGDNEGAHALGEQALVGQLHRTANQLDPAAVVARHRRAKAQQCVRLRPAPDTMTYLTALLPVAAGVGAYAALRRAADTTRAQGDPRSRGQVMADLLVTRALGQVDDQRRHRRRRATRQRDRVSRDRLVRVRPRRPRPRPGYQPGHQHSHQAPVGVVVTTSCVSPVVASWVQPGACFTQIQLAQHLHVA